MPAANTTHGIVHAGFSGFAGFVARKKCRCNLIGNRFVMVFRRSKMIFKPGEQMHIQIIVSRKDATNSIKLSPLNNSKGKNQLHSQKVGQFDRTAFKQTAEKLFDKAFGYERELKETFKYANILKHGSYEQKRELQEKPQGMQNNHCQVGILNTLLGKVSEDYMPNIPQRRKKKKKHEHRQGLGL